MATLAVGHAPTRVDCDLRAALDAAGVIGTWYWSASNGRFILDEGAASLLAGDGALAGAMLLPDRARARMLESDHARFERRFRIACRLGGSFFTEYRARSAEGYRSVIERGRLFHDEAGRPTHGQGIVLDVTEPADKPFSIVPAVHGERAEALDLAADHAIACRQALDRLAHSELRLLADLLLMRLGQEIAR